MQRKGRGVQKREAVHRYIVSVAYARSGSRCSARVHPDNCPSTASSALPSSATPEPARRRRQRLRGRWKGGAGRGWWRWQRTPTALPTAPLRRGRIACCHTGVVVTGGSGAAMPPTIRVECSRRWCGCIEVMPAAPPEGRYVGECRTIRSFRQNGPQEEPVCRFSSHVHIHVYVAQRVLQRYRMRARR